MTTLGGRHPVTAIRTRSQAPASLLTVMLIAAVTLAAAVGIALMTEDDSGSPTVQSSESAATPAVRSSAQPGVLTPRVTETPNRPAQVPAGARYDGGPEEGSALISGIAPAARYDGGPEEGSRGVAGGSGSTDLSRPHYDGRSLVQGSDAP